MEEASKAVYQTLRDDSTATVGLRALLGNTTTTPYNVHYAFLPEHVDFSPSAGNVGHVVVLLASSIADIQAGSIATRLMQDVYQITAYARSLSTVRAAHSRIRWILEHKRKMTNPTSDDVIQKIALEGYGPDRYDDAFDCRWQVATYRVWRRDDDISR